MLVWYMALANVEPMVSLAQGSEVLKLWNAQSPRCCPARLCSAPTPKPLMCCPETPCQPNLIGLGTEEGVLNGNTQK